LLIATRSCIEYATTMHIDHTDSSVHQFICALADGTAFDVRAEYFDIRLCAVDALWAAHW